jgi:hypothetical protein
MQTLITMEKNILVEGMGLNGNHDLSFCDGCVYGKQHHTSFPLIEGFRAKEIFRFVHIDLCGPMAITSHGRVKYF